MRAKILNKFFFLYFVYSLQDHSKFKYTDHF